MTTLLSWSGTSADTGIPNWLAAILIVVAAVLYLGHLVRKHRGRKWK